jgi:hypothetical protein
MSDEHIDVDSLGHKMQGRADKSVAVTVVECCFQLFLKL